jgi:hypothetical protein
MKVRLALAALAAGLTVFACDDEDATAPANTPLVFTADLSADSMVPPVDAEATGTASFTMTTGTATVFDPNSLERKIVTYSISVGDLSGEAVSAAIRGPADVSTSAPILVPLTVTSTDTTGLIISGTFTATSNPAVSIDSLLTLLRGSNVYVSIQTEANPLGELRGQIRPQ